MNSDSSNSEKLLESLKKEARYCILECSVFIEEKASDTLGRILDINWKNSESLGYGSASLSFDHKIRLIQDLKGVDKVDKRRFQCFMAIRNKFAHLAEVDSFDSYFRIIKSSKDRQKELKAWFPDLKWDSTDIEGLYKFAFLLLAFRLFRVLFDIDIKHVYVKAKEQGRKEALEIFMKNVKTRLQKTEEGNEILDQVFASIKGKNDG